MSQKPPNMSLEDAIYDVRERMVRIETVLTGVPGTNNKGLCGTVEKNEEDLDTNRKKVGRLEVRFWLLVGLLCGSGVLGGVGISALINSVPK